MQETEQINITYGKHLFETLKGNFYQEFDSSLNEIVILYTNRAKKEGKNLKDINDFIDKYAQILRESLRNYFSSILWRRETRRVIFQWKKRVLFLVKKRKDIFIELLLRDDFNTESAIKETILKINFWLNSLDDVTLMQNWILENDQEKPTLENIRKYDEIMSVSNLTNFPKEEKYFWQLLNGKTDEEKKKLFDFIISKLLDKYIFQLNSNSYKWKNESKGKLKEFGGLIHVLFKNNYLLTRPSSKEFSILINQWLIHTFEASSLEKQLQTESCNKYINNPAFNRYTEDFETYFPKKK